MNLKRIVSTQQHVIKSAVQQLVLELVREQLSAVNGKRHYVWQHKRERMSATRKQQLVVLALALNAVVVYLTLL